MSLFDLLFPPMCPYCGKQTDNVCETCAHCRSLTEIAPHKRRLTDKTVCYSAYEYEGVVRRAIIDYKYKNHSQYAKSFAKTYQRVIEQAHLKSEYDVYTAVPTHHHAERGRFDQMKRIVVPVARFEGVEYKQLMTPSRKTTAQHTLNREMRKENAKGLYAASEPQYIEGKRILIFDDVITTGATLMECAEVLYNAGAAKVDCITLAW